MCFACARNGVVLVVNTSLSLRNWHRNCPKCGLCGWILRHKMTCLAIWI